MSKHYLEYTYRIYPNKKQQNLINLTFKVCSEIHNLMLKERAYIYNKFILYVQRCLINKIEIDEERFFKHNSPKTIEEVKKIKPYYSKVDDFAIYNEQISIVDAYNKYFSGVGGFPENRTKSNKLLYNTLNINNSICIKKESIILPKLGNVKMNINKNIPKNAVIKRAAIKSDNKGKFYVCIVFIIS